MLESYDRVVGFRLPDLPGGLRPLRDSDATDEE